MMARLRELYKNYLLARIERELRRAHQKVKRHGSKMPSRCIDRLERHNLLSAEELLEVKARVYDFQMERGIARSEKGIKTFGHLGAAESFRRCMFLQYQRHIVYPNPLRPFFEDKQMCYDFIDRLGVRRPVCYPPAKLEEVLARCREGVDLRRYMVKPLSSCNSKGIYLVGPGEEVFRIKGGIQLQGLEAMEKALHEDIASGAVEDPGKEVWYIEEAITIDPDSNRPARDLKFFAFYGEVGVVAEIDRTDGAKVTWWTPDMKPTKGFWGFEDFKGNGFTKEELELAKFISGNIPLPYARIDLLKSSEETVFGEIEVNTGGFEKMVRSTDKVLGRCYLEAETRLFLDVWAGKEFPELVESAKAHLPEFAEYWKNRRLPTYGEIPTSA